LLFDYSSGAFRNNNQIGYCYELSWKSSIKFCRWAIFFFW